MLEFISGIIGILLTIFILIIGSVIYLDNSEDDINDNN